MSLDYILVKSKTPAQSIEDVDAGPSFGAAGYRQTAEIVFPGLLWQGEDYALVVLQDVTVELRLSAVSLSLAIRGSGDIGGFVSRLAGKCVDFGIITIDVQTSTLVDPDSICRGSDYFRWYERVLSDTDG